ncbi:MAG: hypothetical protein WCH40_02380, partial [Verrucomicrobiales bacterium]
MSVQSDAATGLLEVNRDGLREQAGMRGPDHAVAALTSEFLGEREPEKTVDNKDSENDTAINEVRTGLVTVPDDHSTADEHAEETKHTERQKLGSPSAADSIAGSSDNGDAVSTSDAAIVPQLNKQSLESLLDELTGELVALEDFPHEIDDRAFEPEWLGAHNDISREAIREELLRTGRYTAHIDDAGNLLSDPEEYRLAVELGVQITFCVHRGRTEDQKREFILRSQTGKRILTYEEQRELTNRLIVVQLR